ncbi:MAG TPA: M20/M25/M40 family metallo-hydrolase [Candidatus Angelobacter sp.]|nr:M20/M25/M40 family metallo-hydrolase [Candidatus Angelobacter sp.]
MKAHFRCLVVAVFLLACTHRFSGQKVAGSLVEDLREFTETPAVAGYEQELASKIAARLKAFSPRTDGMGNVTITLGTGLPHRLIVAPMDEPGFVVSNITADGYLQVQRLPQIGSLPLFNELHSAQPVRLQTSQGQWISGAVAGISIHLFPQRQHPPSLADLDNIFIDIGATTAAQAKNAGADRLSPLAIDRRFYEMGAATWTSPAMGDRFGDAVLVELLRQLDAAKVHGKLTVAFVAQQWLGARGLERLLYTLKPDELIYVGRLMRAPPPAANAPAPREPAPAFSHAPGSGVLIASEKPLEEVAGLGAELKQLAEQNSIAISSDYSAPLEPRGGYLVAPPLPQRSVHLSVATAWPSTPGEVIDGHDVTALLSLLENYLQGQAPKADLPEAKALPEPSLPARPRVAPSPETILKRLIETYGVSGGHEANVAKAIAQLLPPWAKTETDEAGNLWLRWKGNGKGPSIAVVAHQDEIGYEVHSILPDGRLELESKGGGVLAYFLGHAALVHSANGMHPGVLELPEGWDKPDFQWPRGLRMMWHMDVGAHNPNDAAQLGIKVGDFVTIPKKYRQLVGSRASARAFDDRVGCASLVAAAWALGPNLNGRDVTFIWSTSEELGLEGAAAAAKKLGADGRAPDYLFAVDTFVSSDSPIESPRFGDAILGQGFVVRAVDNSNVVPRKLMEKAVALAHAAGAAVQYGVTGGGNDGAAFLVYGSTDVAMGWPLRYSHSPGEVIDVRDLDALAKEIAAVARNW